MKRFVLFLCVIVTALGSVFAPIASAEETSDSAPVYAEDLNDGVYKIEVESSSSMFRIVDCDLIVDGEKMNAVMTLSGQGYEKLFMGTGEEAEQSGEENYIYFKENDEGKYTYEVPVEALNLEIDCAAWSIKKEKWYDRVLVFESGDLPEEAFKSGVNILFIIIPSIFAAAAVIIIIAAVISKKHKKTGDT